jgi:hypothetical protein
MDRRLIIPAVMAAIAAALPARAQFQPTAVRMPAWPATQVGVGAIGGAARNDLLLAAPGTNASYGYYPDGDLWTRARPVPYAMPGKPSFNLAVGSFDGGAAPDAVFEVDTSNLSVSAGYHVAWGSAPGVIDPFPALYSYRSHGIAAIRLLPRPAPVLVATFGQTQSQSSVYVYDLLGAKGKGVLTSKLVLPLGTYFFTSLDDDQSRDQVYAIRASPAAVALGMSDGALPLMRGFRLIWNRTAAGVTTLGGLAVDYVDVGAWDILSPWPAWLLEPGLSLEIGSSCFGVAGLDVDGDGVRDLIFTMRESPGKLLWLRSDGTAAGLASATWHSLMSRPDLQPLVDPRVLRQVELAGGATIVALHDVALDQILLISGDGVSGFTVRRLPAFGGLVKELWTADVVGTSAPDLLVAVAAPGGGDEVWVYPDDAATPTSYLAWASGNPATAPLDSPLPLSVAPAIAGGAVSLHAAGPSGTITSATSFVIPAAGLCDGSPPLDVYASASIIQPGEDLGVFQEIRTSVPLAAAPSLSIAGSGAPNRIVLAPQGGSGRAEGIPWPACQFLGAPVFNWAATGLPGFALDGQQPPGAETAWAQFSFPVASYPTLLSGVPPLPAITLTASGPAVAAGSATLPIGFDASGLVGVSVAFDEAALAAGEVSTARVTLASRIGVPLPRVRAEVRLAGLLLAGKLQVSGALAADLEERAAILESLPAAPATVELDVPVRSVGSPGGVAVELFSEGGYRLSPETDPSADSPPLPGCGCGQRGAAEGLPILLFVILFKVKSPFPHRPLTPHRSVRIRAR